MRRTGAPPTFALAGLLLGGAHLGCGPRGPAGPDAVPPPAPEIEVLTWVTPKVVFLGLDGADWELLDDYMARGVMPNLAQLVREGRAGVLITQHPPLSPLLWTTMVTGHGPLTHGILDFTRFHPQTGAREPITSDERRVPAVWNMATLGGKSVAVFGLWATYPAEPVRGLLVSDRLFSFQHAERRAPPGAVFPAAREAWAQRTLAEVETEVDRATLRRILPAATDTADPRVAALRRILIETLVQHRLATRWLDEHAPDLALVYFQGTDAIGHVFAPFVPPASNAVATTDVERFGGVAERYFALIDELLGEYRTRALAAGGRLLLASDHGFHWKGSRPDSTPSLDPATAGRWHRDEGLYLLWGAGIAAAAERAERAGVERVCSTLLALAGLPAGRDLAGPPLAGFASPSTGTVDYAASYQPLLRTSVPARPDAVATDLAELRALGYVGAAEPVAGPVDGSTRTAGSYNHEGLILRGTGRTAEAEAAFERAIALDSRHSSALRNLSDLLHGAARDLDRSDDLLLRALATGTPEGPAHVIGRAIAYQRAGRTERGERLLAAALEARPEVAELWLFRGRYLVERGECAGALSAARTAQRLEPGNALAHAAAGLARLCLGEREAGLRELEHSLELDPEQPELRRLLER